MNRYISCTLPVFLLLAYMINCCGCVSSKSRLAHNDQNGDTGPMNEFESGPLMNAKTKQLEIATADNSLTNRVKVMQSLNEIHDPLKSLLEPKYLYPELQGITEAIRSMQKPQKKK